jgi:hypothetical protein
VDIGSVESASVSVSGTVFNDTSGEGTNLASDSGLAGQKVYADIHNAGGYQTGDPSAVTDSNGNYALYGVPQGAVIIRELIPTGERQTLPAGGMGQHVTVGSSPMTGVNFGATSNIYISGTVTINGVGQSGVLVYAQEDDLFNYFSAYTLTGPGGFYSIGSLPGSNDSASINYTIAAAPAGSFVQALPVSTTQVSLPPGGVQTGVNFAFVSPPPAYLTGTVIGSAGSYANSGNVAANAFDGNLNTYFDGPSANGDYVGLQLPTATVIQQISFAPRAGWAGRMVGGVFQGSNSPSFSSAVTLYTITQAPAVGVLTSVTVSNPAAFKYLRYVGPAGSYGDVAEVQFFNAVQPIITISGDTLTVTGTSGNDNISVSAAPTVVGDDNTNSSIDGPYVNFTIEENSVVEELTSYGMITKIIINSGAGNDNVSVSDGTPNAGNYNGPSLSFIINGGNGNDTVSSDLAMDDVTLGNGNDNVTFLDGGFVTLVAGNGNDVVTSSPMQGGGAESITLGNGNNSVVLQEPFVSGEDITLNVGNGQNVINNKDADNNVSLSVNGAAPIDVQWSETEITGKAFVDTNGDGLYENGEPPLANVEVYFDVNDTGAYTAGDPVTLTDANGNYIFTGLNQVGDTYANIQPVRALPISGYTIESQDQNLSINNVTNNDGGYAYTGYDFAMQPTQPQKPLTGTVIGTSGSYNNQGNTAAKAFDGNLGTYFDAPTASGSWAGLDLGLAKVITSISYAPRSGWANRMVGGVFQASNSATFTSGVVNLYIVSSTPAVGSLTTVSISNSSAYRYVRYFGPATGYCDIAEAQFFGTNPTSPTKLAGTPIGTPGSYRNHGTTIANAFDGSLTTFFDGPDASGDWVGLDLGSARIVTQVDFAARTGWANRMVGGEIQASNTADFSSGVVTLYTITSTPTAGVFTTQPLSNSTAYRYYRYIGPANSYCDIAELEFDG